MKTINKLGVKDNKIVNATNIKYITFLDMESMVEDDKHSITDIELCIRNDRESHEKMKQLMVNYAKKEVKGQFNDGLALKGIVNNIIVPYVKRYNQMFNSPNSTVGDVLTINDRYIVADLLINAYEDILDEYVEMYEKEQEEKNKKYMSKKVAEQIWKEEIVPHVNKSDKPALMLSWHVFIDTLCKDGEISQKQYDTWACPKVCK